MILVRLIKLNKNRPKIVLFNGNFFDDMKSYKPLKFFNAQSFLVPPIYMKSHQQKFEREHIKRFIFICTR